MYVINCAVNRQNLIHICWISKWLTFFKSGWFLQSLSASSPVFANRENEGPRAMSSFNFIAAIYCSWLFLDWGQCSQRGSMGILGRTVLYFVKITHCNTFSNIYYVPQMSVLPPITGTLKKLHQPIHFLVPPKHSGSRTCVFCLWLSELKELWGSHDLRGMF